MGFSLSLWESPPRTRRVRVSGLAQILRPSPNDVSLFLRLRPIGLALRVLRLRPIGLALRVLRLRPIGLALRVLRLRPIGLALRVLRLRPIGLALRVLRLRPIGLARRVLRLRPIGLALRAFPIEHHRPFQIRLGNRPAVRSPHESGENLLRAHLCLAGLGRPVDEYLAAARRVAGRLCRIWSSDGKLRNGRSNTGMTSFVEVHREWLPRRLEQRRGIPDKGGAYVMWTGLHRYTNLKVLVEKLIVAVGGFLDRNRPNRRPVEQQLHLVWLRVPQAVDVPGIAAREVNLDVGLSGLREIVTNRNPTTPADRQSRSMLFLRDVFRDANDVALHRCLRNA